MSISIAGFMFFWIILSCLYTHTRIHVYADSTCYTYVFISFYITLHITYYIFCVTPCIKYITLRDIM